MAVHLMDLVLTLIMRPGKIPLRIRRGPLSISTRTLLTSVSWAPRCLLINSYPRFPSRQLKIEGKTTISPK